MQKQNFNLAPIILYYLVFYYMPFFISRTKYNIYYNYKYDCTYQKKIYNFILFFFNKLYIMPFIIMIIVFILLLYLFTLLLFTY